MSDLLTTKPVLDACCGSRMFWFDKTDDNTLFCDIRNEDHTLCDGRQLDITPDILADFAALPFSNEAFRLVVFDPPHMEKLGVNSWMAKKYGKLDYTWRDDIAQGFNECFRVLMSGGTLIFKWNETQIKTSDVLSLTKEKPLFGHISGKRSNTHWICFMKEVQELNNG